MAKCRVGETGKVSLHHKTRVIEKPLVFKFGAAAAAAATI